MSALFRGFLYRVALWVAGVMLAMLGVGYILGSVASHVTDYARGDCAPGQVDP